MAVKHDSKVISERRKYLQKCASLHLAQNSQEVSALALRSDVKEKILHQSEIAIKSKIITLYKYKQNERLT